ncbi:hypothetical protein ACN28E_20750 [Archangium lansingense]|uniref:hypothetical protein n=1 Tax=Archangium lansingense TaxID=2995310 RepID=UPI003B7C6F38
MDSKKLFHVLVLGGALLGGVSGCVDEAKAKPNDKADAGTTPQTDGGTGGEKPGGGVQGW